MSTLTQHVILKKNEDRRLLGGHQWIFSNELHRIVGTPETGAIVEILRSDGRSLGIGMYNPSSLIAVRFLSPTVEEITQTFFERRITAALALRTRLYPESSTYRVVNGEGDFLPGLIIDRYEDILSVQTFSAGMDLRLPMICDALESVLHPAGIIERNESPLRTLEGLPLRKGILRGTNAVKTVSLHGIKFSVDALAGQKSGFFLDQRENRTAIAPYVKNASVLDCFCNEGGFGLYAAKFGARQVDAVDISSDAVRKATENATVNELSSITFHTEDAFQFLERAVKEQRRWDVVILDPPSFTKSKKTVATAVKGYKEINTSGFSLVPPGGFLVSASCSHHIDRDTFIGILSESGVKAGRRFQLLHLNGASPDHPTLPSMPETQYLTFAVCRVE